MACFLSIHPRIKSLSHAEIIHLRHVLTFLISVNGLLVQKVCWDLNQVFCVHFSLSQEEERKEGGKEREKEKREREKKKKTETQGTWHWGRPAS